MEKRWITAPAPNKGRAAWTIAGSVVLHGAIVAVAALWPVRYATPPTELPPTDVIFTEAGGDAVPPIPESNPAPPAVPSDPPPMAVDTSIDTPPTPEEPSMDIATPKPVVKNVVNKLHLVRPASSGTSSSSMRSAPTMATGPGTLAGAGHSGAMGHWHTPRPPYPYALRAARIAGSGSVRITTDGAGWVTSASIVQSTGNAFLDENTLRFARSDWNGPPNATATVPITYQMQ